MSEPGCGLVPLPGLPAPTTFRVIWTGSPFQSRRDVIDLPVGMTLADVVARLPVPEGMRSAVHVTVLGTVVPEIWRPRVRPKAGQFVSVLVRPGKGGGSANIIRTIAILAVVIIAAIVAPYAVAGLGLTGVAAAAATAAIAATITTAGILAINAFFPPPTETLARFDDDSSRTYALEAARNESRLFGVIPRLLGRRRVFPLYCSKPYTELIGEDIYLRSLFTAGHGPLLLSDFRLGETPLQSFLDVEIQVKPGYAGGPPITLFATSPDELALSVTLDIGAAHVQRTPDNSDEVVLEFTFPGGLYRQGEVTGDRSTSYVLIRVESRVPPSGAYTVLTNARFERERATPFREPLRFYHPRGERDYRITLIERGTGQNTHVNDVAWTMFRSFTHADPFLLDQMAEIAVRIRASEQLSGAIDTLSCLAEAVVRDWDKASGTWIARVTSNPASLLREVYQGRAHPRPWTNDRLDLPAFQAWHEFCAGQNLNFDGYIDYKSTVGEIADQICAVGKGRRVWVDGKRSVVWDDPQSPSVWMVTPRVMRSYRASRTLVPQPHAFRVRFPNAGKEWRQDERLIFADGYNITNATRYAEADTAFITNQDQVWRFYRYQMAQVKLRPERHEIELDWEQLRISRGDRFALAHDAILVSTGTARIRALTLDGAGAVIGVALDDLVGLPTGACAAQVRRRDGTQVVLPIVERATAELTQLTFAAPLSTADRPAVGDLVAVGPLGSITLDLLCTGVEPQSDIGARITAVDFAPNLALAEQGSIPPHDSQISTPVDALPPAPVIVAVVTDERVLSVAADGTILPRVAFRLRSRPVYTTAVEVQAWRGPASGLQRDWRRLPLDEDRGLDVVAAGIEEGVVYRFRMRFTTPAPASGPWTETTNIAIIGKLTPPRTPTAGRHEIGPAGHRLVWDLNPERDVRRYRVTKITGPVADPPRGLTAIGSASAETDASQIELGYLVAGSYAFEVRAVDTGGRVSAGALSIAFQASGPAAPVITAEVSDNYVYLRARSAAEQPIRTFEFRRGDSFDGSSLVTATDGGFWAQFEPIAGTYRYWVTAVDLASNRSPPAQAQATVDVPRDFELLETWEADFGAGVLTNMHVEGGELLGPVVASRTWDTLMAGNGWTSWDQKGAAGYPIWAQPAAGSGSYRETFDYGVIVPGTTLTVTPEITPVAGSVTVTPLLETSVDGSTWTSWGSSWSAKVGALRYVRITLQLVPDTPAGLVLVDLTLRLTVRSLVDVWSAEVEADDVDGTAVLLRKPFLDLAGVTASPIGGASRTATVEWDDVPNPLSVRVKLWEGGDRVDGFVSITAGGTA